MNLSKMRHCLDLSSWTVEQYQFFFMKIQALKSQGYAAIKKATNPRPIGLIFQEASTRTRVSFEKVADHLGCPTYLIESNTSLSKGESVLDTVYTLSAMGIKDFVIRSSTDEIFEIADRYSDGFLINAGSGSCHHPTQGLLDAYTVWETFGRLQNLQITMVGDLVHSRVARSNIQWMKAFGICPKLCGPAPWVDDFEMDAIDIKQDMDEAIADADVVILHRVQNERLQANETYHVADFTAQYGMTIQRLAQIKANAIVMHPGPINRGIEIQSEVADHAKSKIQTQVENGVWTRIALLQMLLGSGE